MKDPERLDDTDPTGPPVDTADTDPGGGDVTIPNDSAVGELDELPNEEDDDDFFRWLPTLWNRHRRHAELVERPSSEGADFAAYACEGRPAAASGRVRREAKVQVRTDVSTRSRSRRRVALDEPLEASGREAPTVVKRRRRFASGRALVGWGAAGLLAVSASIWWSRGRQATEAPVSATAAGTLPLPTARTLAERAEPSGPPLPPAPLPGGPQGTDAPAAPAAQRATAFAPVVKAVKAARRKGERPEAPVDGSARSAGPLTAPAVPVKDQFFEDP